MQDTNAPSDGEAQIAREEWVKPKVARMAAGEAELGPTPLSPEGSFGFGS